MGPPPATSEKKKHVTLSGLWLAVTLIRPGTALYHVSILMAGRPTGPKDWQTIAFDEYRSRLRGTIDLDVKYYKSLDNELKRRTVLCLDATGRRVDSKEFSDLLFDKLHEGGSRLALAVGPAEGFPDDIRKNNDLLSLSALTFPHQLVKVILAEQIYRAAEIRKGSAYHK